MAGKRDSDKAKRLLAEHETSIIKQLGSRAFDMLTPAEVAIELRLESTRRIPELMRLGWLESVPDKDVGKAHQYYRWRVEFVKKYKQPRKAKETIPS
jgi:hypothetical protein